MLPTRDDEAPDTVARALSPAGEAVRLRDKHVARSAALAVLGGALVFLLAGIAVALGADPAAPRVAALVPLSAFAVMVYQALANTVVRTVVTDRAVYVQWGLRRMEVPLASITHTEALARSGGPTASTGAGWSLFAHHGAVHLRWTQSSETRALLLPAHNPTALAEAISSARIDTTGARIDAAAPGHAEPLAAAEAAEQARARSGARPPST